MTPPGSPDQPTLLVCFAVPEETKFFEPIRVSPDCRQLITGMGKKNAAESLRRALSGGKTRLVVTAGFAGGLNSEFPMGAVIFESDEADGPSRRLAAAGALPAKFHCAESVAVTAAEKRALRQSTGADAVEMESGVIRAICRELKIPAVTVRVISDAADEDLPLDFNRLMTPDYRIDTARLAGSLVSAPWKIPSLIKFQKRTVLAARNLAAVLEKSLVGTGG